MEDWDGRTSSKSILILTNGARIQGLVSIGLRVCCGIQSTEHRLGNCPRCTESQAIDLGDLESSAIVHLSRSSGVFSRGCQGSPLGACTAWDSQIFTRCLMRLEPIFMGTNNVFEP